jgi:hypothetical protein
MSLLEIIISILAVTSGLIYVFGSLIKIRMDLKKFDGLDISVQEKLSVIKYYMVAVRNLGREDLIKLSKLTEEELKEIDRIVDYNERVKAMKERIKGIEIGKNSPQCGSK